MAGSSIIRTEPLGFTWPVTDPFLFCAHHLDRFPAGTPSLGPPPEMLRGRDIGNDFTLRDGWRMYHGDTIPGFPEHPHRGFETVTIVMQGMVDHADSLGQAGRYGNGDVQWMTAGAGLQHSEMFPLLSSESENPAELFQLWLNLPASRKFEKPHYKMIWAEEIPLFIHTDPSGKKTEVRVIAGALEGMTPPSPAPGSWASDPGNGLAIRTILMEPGARWTLPPADNGSMMMIGYYRGDSLSVDGTPLKAGHAAFLRAGMAVTLENGPGESFLLQLQGRPIGEPVVQYGPFVMNTREEVSQAFEDYRKTSFGGWPWPRRDMVHPAGKGRFATFSDGSEKIPPIK